MSPTLFQLYALRFVGVPYVWGGSHPAHGFDCSGFAQELLAALGLDPIGDQTAQALYDHASAQGWKAKLGAGALVFYGKSTKEISHVAVLLDSLTVIEAGGAGRNAPTPEAAAKLPGAFVRIRPLQNRKDLIAIMNPGVFGV